MKKNGASLLATAVVLFLLFVAGYLNSTGDTKDLPALCNVEILYTFRSEKLFDSHYEKHGAEFGEITQEEYLALANRVIASETALHKIETEDGDTVIYEEEDNMFLILSTDGYIRTFFRPDGGIQYYERQ